MSAPVAWQGQSQAQHDAHTHSQALTTGLTSALATLTASVAAKAPASAAWAASTAYAAGQMVTYGGRVYQARTSFTSGTVFDPANWTVVASTPLSTATALRGWYAALANRDSAQAKAMHVGDSTTEGGTLTAISQRWLDRLAAHMRARYPVTGVVGGAPSTYLPAAWGVGSSIPAPATIGGSPGQHANGLGRRGYSLTASGQSVTWTVTGRLVDIAFTKQSGLGIAAVAIDGIPAAALNTASGATGSFVSAVARYDLSTTGTHTVAVTWTSGTVMVEGIVTYSGDSTAGILHYDAGHFGYTTNNFQAAATNAWMTTAAWLQPQLITINVGINDYKQNRGAAAYTTDLNTIIASLRANLTAPAATSILLIKASQPTHPSTPTEPWANYVAADYAIAAADTGGPGGASGIAVLELGTRMPTPTTDNTLALYNADLTHPTAKGNAFIADVLLAVLSNQ